MQIYIIYFHYTTIYVLKEEYFDKMKTPTIIFAALVLVVPLAEGQQYFPFPSENAQWNVYLLTTCAKPNIGEPVLYKLLYFSDFNFYEIGQSRFDSNDRGRKGGYRPCSCPVL